MEEMGGIFFVDLKGDLVFTSRFYLKQGTFFLLGGWCKEYFSCFLLNFSVVFQFWTFISFFLSLFFFFNVYVGIT